MPLIDINEKELKKHAKEVIEANITITGAQPKLSLWLKESKQNIRFTIIDQKSNFIIKLSSIRVIRVPFCRFRTPNSHH